MRKSVIWTISSEGISGSKAKGIFQALDTLNQLFSERLFRMGMSYHRSCVPKESPSEGFNASRALQRSVGKQDQWATLGLSRGGGGGLFFVNIRTKSCTTSSEPPGVSERFLRWLCASPGLPFRCAEPSAESLLWACFSAVLQRLPRHLCSDHCCLFPVLFLPWKLHKISSFGK